ncbi:MAG TPA: hypothetical protein PK977_01440 [Chitinophagaceae bacterium]|nr:hypothetical protein [Chitinophagaceae bacterium]
MKEIEFITNEKMKDVLLLLEEAANRKADVAFNLFTISNYAAYLENFHSDILKSLLDPSSHHGEGYMPLQTFISYLP